MKLPAYSIELTGASGSVLYVGLMKHGRRARLGQPKPGNLTGADVRRIGGNDWGTATALVLPRGNTDPKDEKRPAVWSPIPLIIQSGIMSRPA